MLACRPLSGPSCIPARLFASSVPHSTQAKMFQTLTFSSGSSFPAVRHRTPLRPMTVPGRNNRMIAASAVAGTAGVRERMNLYEVLQVRETASRIEIKTAYRSLAKRFHPDALPRGSDGREFIQIREAYATLSDPMARARYDRSIGRFRFGVVGSPDESYTIGAGFWSHRWETDQCW